VRRGGFTLVEVVVSITLLSVTVLTLAASGALAAGVIRTAEREEAATRFAGSLLDSLVLAPEPGGGTVVNGDMVANWSGAGGGPITLSVSYQDAGSARVHRWSAHSLAGLRFLPGRQGEP